MNNPMLAPQAKTDHHPAVQKRTQGPVKQMIILSAATP